MECGGRGRPVLYQAYRRRRTGSPRSAGIFKRAPWLFLAYPPLRGKPKRRRREA